MKLSDYSEEARAGLIRWATDVYDDPAYFEDISLEEWAWAWFLLSVSSDNPEWFPHGKWGTLQFFRAELEEEARREITERAKG